MTNACPPQVGGLGAAELLTLDDYERAAAQRLSQLAYDYYRSGAGAERTLQRNRAAFSDWAIWPRVLVDVAERDLRTTVLGTAVDMPILVAPTAYHRLAHPDGEPATARGAADVGTLFVASTLATTTLEEIAAASPGPKWFQLYVHKDRGATRELVARAQAAGYGALVVTVDTPILGRRLADLRNGFTLPPGLTMANFDEASGPSIPGESDLLRRVAARHDAAFCWADLDWLRSLSPLPIILKGILRADDAARAVEHGVGAIIVSNHGGRQLDGAPGTLDALPDVVAAAADRCQVLIDGGLRSGSDIFTALALGARAVLLGRPVLWGLTVGGREGVARVLAHLRGDLSDIMALAGCARLADITPDMVRRVPR